MNILLAFGAGILSFISPCVLPLIPAYISFLTGSSIDELAAGHNRTQALKKSAGFVLGFSVIFILLGLSISSIGRLLIMNQVVLQQVAGVLILILGIHVTGLIKLPMLWTEKRIFSPNRLAGGSSMLVGMAFAAGWTPCVGPMLSSILLYAGSMETIWRGTLLLVAYSAGLAVPFLLTAAAIGRFMNSYRRLTVHARMISLISGILLIILGFLMFSNRLVLFNQYFSFLPIF